MNTEHILITEGVLLEKECLVCCSKFINVKDSDYPQFLDKIIEKYNLPKTNKFEEETTCLCYDDRFECLTCKNIVCCGCTMHMPDYENGKQLNNYATFNSLAIYGYRKKVYDVLDQESTGIITCPICRTKDYRLLYTDSKRGLLSEEILYDIKNFKR